MSLLPQRKKSAEEIAKLRENLGVPALQETADKTQALQKAADAPPALQVTAEATPAPAEKDPSPSPEPVIYLPKRVRSLRKSEQIPSRPIPLAEPVPDSKLPSLRHSDEEITAIRRREALERLAPPPPNPKLVAAHPALLIPGYLAALAGAACFFDPAFPMEATAGCATSALLIAAFVSFTKPLSSHHAGFIAVIALFVLAFGTLHYFPHLLYAT